MLDHKGFSLLIETFPLYMRVGEDFITRQWLKSFPRQHFQVLCSHCVSEIISSLLILKSGWNFSGDAYCTAAFIQQILGLYMS